MVNDTYARFGIEKRYELTDGRKGTGVSLQTVHHELLLTEFQNAVRATVGERSDLQLAWSERRFSARDRKLTFQEQGTPVSVVPDAGFLIRQREGIPYEMERKVCAGCARVLDEKPVKRLTAA